MALRDGVVNLVLRVRNLMSKGSEEASESLTELRAEGEKLEDKLRDLGRQDDAVKGFDDTKRAADDATRELERTVKEYENLRKVGRQAGETQGEYALKVKQARTAQSLANTEYRRSQRDLAKHTRTLRDAGIETDDLSGAEKRVQRELEETRRSLDRVNDEAARHARELKEASDSGNRFQGMLSGLKGRVLGLAAGIGIFETLRRGFLAVVNISSDAEKLQKRLDALFGGAEEGARAMDELDAIAERNAQSLQDTADAAIRLKVFGFDPLDGTLQRLIDANEKYGQGAQTLETLTTQLGQAYTSNRLQLEELNSITDAGIPILEALVEVTGRSAGQLRQMASDGKLGRETIQAVVEELGDMAEGAGAKRLTTFQGLLSAVRKEFRDFFREVGEAGVLDTLKDRLGDLLTTMREAAADGSIVRWAQDIAGAFQSTLSVVQRVAAVVGIVLNVMTAGFRSLTVTVLGAVGHMSKALSQLAELGGAEELAKNLRDFANNVRGAADQIVQDIAQDGEDIQRHFKMAFTGAADEAERSAARQKKASKAAADAAVTAADREIAAAEEAAAKKRLLRLREELDAAESFDEIQRLNREANDAQLEYGQAVARRIKVEEAALKQSTKERSQAQILANQQVQDSLDQLGLEYDKLSGTLERRAINNFERIVDQIELSGQEAKVQSRIVAEAYLAAFEEIESRAGQLQATQQLNQALSEGLITQKDYNAALEETGVQASETLERLQRAIQIYKETTELATGAEKDKAAAAKETNQALDEQAAAAEEAGASMEESGRRAVVAGAGITEAAENIRRAFFNVSEEAGQLYDRLLKEQTRGLLSTRSYLNAVGDVATEVNERVGRAQQLYQRAMAAQNEDTGQFIRLAESAIASGRTLGEQKLSGLRSALASAKAQMDGLADSARDTVEGLRDELLQLTGTQEEIQRRQFERREQDLRDQLRQASEQGAGDAVAQYRDALQLNREVYQARRDQQRNEQLQQQQEQAQRQPVRKTEVTLKNDRGDRVTVTAAEGEDAAFLKLLSEAGLRSTQS